MDTKARLFCAAALLAAAGPALGQTTTTTEGTAPAGPVVVDEGFDDWGLLGLLGLAGLIPLLRTRREPRTVATTVERR